MSTGHPRFSYSNPADAARQDAGQIKRANDAPNVIMSEIWSAHEQLKNDPAAYKVYMDTLKSKFQGDTVNLHTIELDDARASDPKTETVVHQLIGLNSHIMPDHPYTYLDVLDNYHSQVKDDDGKGFHATEDPDGKIEKRDIEKFQADLLQNPKDSPAPSLNLLWEQTHPDQRNFLSDLPKEDLNNELLLESIGLYGDSASAGKDFVQQFNAPFSENQLKFFLWR